MESGLEKEFEEYSELILYGKDLEAERFLAVRPQLKRFVTKLMKKKFIRDSYSSIKKRADLRISLIKDVGIPNNCAGILAKEFHEFSPVFLEDLINNYYLLAEGGLPPFASTGALLYIGLSPRDLLDILSVIPNYDILRSNYLPEKIKGSDLGPLELSALSRFHLYFDTREDQGEFVLGMKAAGESYESDTDWDID